MNMFKEPKEGWMIVSLNHPNGSGKVGIPGPVVMLETLALTPEAAIERFCDDSLSWKYWEDNFGDEVRKAKVTIELL